ncbi:autotransporter domain-containing protein [Bradyrhizobium sp. JYMT SZCCT0180]|uniref:autotransporter outer membrane beta-barrel domain-containing protein n=1 Tax=Bradyrhizobium sp. JYMT SZCCT0180 TaxID=2807666 RepID=UPI001BA48E3E|nr:autotransporter domain-containing protein [Bradyrhizobium sp. JYMT SZCCT0180]MBR1213815.1 autotransporter domain-containing protein [Bradyrhizobium sp. JYMT SZCCT0180]
MPSSAQAQSVWGGIGSTTATTDYHLNTNWSTAPVGAPPVAVGQSAQFANTGTASVVVTAGPIAPDSWTFSSNAQSYVVTGGAVNFGGGGLTNDATAGQAISVSNNMTGGTLSQAGASALTISGTSIFATTSVTAGTLINTGSLTSAVTNGATFTNSGTLTGAVTNGGTFNANGGAINGAISNTNTFNVNGTVAATSTVTNTGGLVDVVAGSFTGVTTLTNTFGGFVFVRAGATLGANSIMNGNTSDLRIFGTLTATTITNHGNINSMLPGSVINGDLTNNSGGVNLMGAINGAIVNNGNGPFTVTGNLAGNGTTTSFTNNGTARLEVNNGDFTGITTLTNNSTHAVGISISAGRTLGAISLVNAAGATIGNLGTITTNSTINDGTISGAYAMVAGTLSGVGNTQNLSVNGGTFAPGNGAPGASMTVTGSFVFQSAATYLVQINPSAASFTAVTGAATLNGGTVSANYANGNYIAKRYTIVTAAGGLSGTFGSIVNTNLPGGFQSSLSYDASNAYLNLALTFVPPPGTGLSTNQKNVGNAIVNFFNTTGGIPLVFGALTPAGLTQISGETGTGSQQSTFNAMNQFMGVLMDPFIAGRGDAAIAGGNVPGYADEEALAYAAKKRNPNDALAAIHTKAPSMAPFQQRWSVWAAGFGGSQTTDGNNATGSNAATSRIYGTAIGADYRFSPFTIAGFSLAGGGTSFSVANNGTGRSDLFQAGAFIRHNIGAAYLSGALAYGWQDVTTDRTVTVAGIDQLRARFNANAWSGRAEGGYRFVAPVIGGVGFTPYAAGQFTTFELPAYAEGVISGANTFALAYGAKSVTDTRSELGLRTDKSFAMQSAILTLRGRVAWAHDFNPDRGIGATFQTLPGASFFVNGAAQAANSALVTASAETRWTNGWSTAATFEGEFSNVTRSYAGKGVVRYAW